MQQLDSFYGDINTICTIITSQIKLIEGNINNLQQINVTNIFGASTFCVNCVRQITNQYLRSLTGIKIILSIVIIFVFL